MLVNRHWRTVMPTKSGASPGWAGRLRWAGAAVQVPIHGRPSLCAYAQKVVARASAPSTVRVRRMILMMYVHSGEGGMDLSMPPATQIHPNEWWHGACDVRHVFTSPLPCRR